MRNLLVWLFLLFLLLLFFTPAKVSKLGKAKVRLRRTWREYKDQNRDYVARHSQKEDLDTVARSKMTFLLLSLVAMELALCAVFNPQPVILTSSVAVTTILICMGIPFKKGKLMDRMLAWAQEREYGRHNFNAPLVAVSRKKRDEKREEVLKALAEVRRLS